MNSSNKKPKTMGPLEARFITALYESNRSLFTIDEASEITGHKGAVLSNFLYRLVRKGILTSLTNGLYNIVPFELGEESVYCENPFIIARELVKRRLRKKDPLYYISHGSAMEHHQMVTQPQMIVYVTVSTQVKPVDILGTSFHFIRAREKDFYGTEDQWIDKSSTVVMSNIERTVIDGLKKSQYCGGMTEVAKGLWMKRDKMDISRLIEYALKTGAGSICARLGYLLELYNLADTTSLNKLQEKLSGSYSLFDPSLLNEGEYLARWKIRQNILDAELLSVLRT
jgi:predicted transcriptional regulator of viral defense system